MINLKRDNFWVTRFAEIKDCMFSYKKKPSKSRDVYLFSWHYAKTTDWPSLEHGKTGTTQEKRAIHQHHKPRQRGDPDTFLRRRGKVQEMVGRVCGEQPTRWPALSDASCAQTTWAGAKVKRSNSRWVPGANCAIQRAKAPGKTNPNATVLWRIHPSLMRRVSNWCSGRLLRSALERVSWFERKHQVLADRHER